MRVFVGNDWAEDHHDVEVMDEAGRVLAKRRLPEGVAGIAQLHELIGRHLGEDADEAEVVVGIETGRGPWVQALIAAGYTVFPVNPLQASRYRERHGVSRAKSDGGDAHMLADMVRTDSHQLRPVAGDSPDAEAVKVLARTHKTLIWERTRAVQRLRHQPTYLHPPVIEHTRLGAHLLGETDGVSHTILATALAEALLLAGRIEFFDLRQPDDADATFVRALQAAGEADDALLGSAILAHAAFVPGWSGRSDEFTDRMRAARTYARRAPASAEFLAWLDAVEAECETIGGRTREALRLIEHAEAVLAIGSENASPDWFTWFSRMRLAAFKGNTQLKAGHLPQAKETLTGALNEATAADDKQLTVILGDLAAVEAAQRNPEAACDYAEQALQQLAITWYATGMDRILDVRKTLQPWAEQECVQALDDRLYGWQATLSSLQR